MFKKRFLSLIIIFVICFTFQQWAYSQSIGPMTIEKMRFNILKIDKGIESTKSKIQNIRDAKFLPDLYLSIAELYVTKSKFMYALKIAENKDTPLEELDFTFEKRLKTTAIETYDLLIDKFPNYIERDKAIFFKAHEQRELGNLNEMVQTYNLLTKEYPESPFWAESQIIIGDYYFNQKEDIDFAKDIYSRILKKPLSAFTPLAHYKIGWCYINKGLFKKAFDSFERVLIQFKKVDLMALPENLRKTDVRSDALLAMVWPYSELSKKELKTIGLLKSQPIIYFKELSPNKISYQKVLKKLAQRLIIKNKRIQATRVYFELLRQTSGLEPRMDLIDRLYVSMKNTLNPWPVRGFVQEIVKTLPEIKYSGELKKARIKKALHDYEIYARDITTRQDKRARRMNTTDEYEWAIEDYKSYLWGFQNRKYYYKMTLNLADVYFKAEKYVEAAVLYEKLARKYKSFLETSIQSYIAALKDPDRLNPLQLTEARYGFRDTAKVFIKTNKNHKSIPSIRFSLGQSYYDERQFDLTVKHLKEYINYHPNHKDVPTAANLILDSYHQKEDYKNIVSEGKSILLNKKLKFPNLKSQVSQIIQDAEMKLIQNQAGNSASGSYASNLLQMANKYKGSSLGDKALYEAFIALKSQRDPKAYNVGSELVLKHKNSKYALQVITDMGQMALNSADFKRASLYFELFYERYPNKKESKDLFKSAAQMRELMGDYKLAYQDYTKLKDYTQAAKMDFLGSYWTSLIRSSNKANGIWSHYWKGLAQYRLRGLRFAQDSLINASRYQGNDPEQNEAAAHALYLLSMQKLEEYKKIQITQGREEQAVNEKAMGLAALEERLNKVIKFENGRWTIAALYGLGQAYKEFSEFLINSPSPKGLSKSDRELYKNAINEQAKTYTQTSNNYFSQCASSAERYNVFTGFVKGCLTRGKLEIDEKNETRTFTRTQDNVPPKAVSIKRQLFDDNRNIHLLDQLSSIYLKNKDYSMAEMIQNRILDISPDNAEAIAKIGVIKLYKNEVQESHQWFSNALKAKSNQPHALLGLHGLFNEYRFKNRLKTLRPKLRGVRIPKSFVHPYMTAR